MSPALTPPGPPPFSSVEELRHEPLDFLRQLIAKYGDIVRYHAPGWETTLLNHPQAVRHVLHSGNRKYSKLGTPDLMMLNAMLGDGLMTSVGSWWQHQRQMLQPAFRTGAVRDYASLIVDATRDMLATWSDGAQIEVCDALAQLTLRVIALAMFGHDIQRRSSSFGLAVQMLNESIGHPDPGDQEMRLKLARGLSTIRSVVEEVIARRADSKTCDPAPRDVLDTLNQATDRQGRPLSTEHLRDQVLTLLMAGHETTAKALSWTFYLLDQHREVATRLTSDIARQFGTDVPDPAQLDHVPYLWQVLQESMRLFPPVWVMTRMVREDDEVMGFHLPAGSMVVISPYFLHRHPDFWTQPEHFDPDRFDPERPDDHPPFAFMPFSGGPRSCIGRHLAKLEMQIVLAMCMQRCELRLLAKHPVEPEALVTLRPRRGLPMIIQNRPLS